MAASAPGKVLLRGEPFAFEREAAGVITPGNLIALGSGNTVTREGTGGGWCGWIAVENALAGDDLDHNYASGEVVQIHHCRPGDVVYALLADGQNAAIGDRLQPAASGELSEISGDSAAILEGQFVAIALEALDLSDSSGADPASRRIQVLIV